MKNKIDLINDCFSMLLRTGVTVNASPDDNVLALNRLEDMMAELESRNLATGYNFEDSPEPDSPSGLENWMNLAISQMLAMRVWPDFSPDEVNPMLARNSAQSSANLSARLAQQNALKYARRTPLGSGNQPYQQYNKFFGDYGSACGPSDASSGGCAPVPTPPPLQCSCDVIPLRHLKLLGDEALFGASEKQYSITGFYDGSTIGGGLFVFNPDGNKSTHNGVTVYAPEALQAWAGTQADIATLLNWTGAGSGVWVRADLQGFVTPEMAGASGSLDAKPIQAWLKYCCSGFAGAASGHYSLESNVAAQLSASASISCSASCTFTAAAGFPQNKMINISTGSGSGHVFRWSGGQLIGGNIPNSLPGQANDMFYFAAENCDRCEIVLDKTQSGSDWLNSGSDSHVFIGGARNIKCYIGEAVGAVDAAIYVSSNFAGALGNSLEAGGNFYKCATSIIVKRKFEQSSIYANVYDCVNGVGSGLADIAGESEAKGGDGFYVEVNAYRTERPAFFQGGEGGIVFVNAYELGVSIPGYTSTNARGCYLSGTSNMTVTVNAARVNPSCAKNTNFVAVNSDDRIINGITNTSANNRATINATDIGRSFVESGGADGNLYLVSERNMVAGSAVIGAGSSQHRTRSSAAEGFSIDDASVSLGGVRGAEALRVIRSTGQVNYLQVAGALAAAAAGVIVSSQGSDTNVAISISPKGSAPVYIGGAGGSETMRVQKGAANGFDVQSAGAGSSPAIVARGADASVDFRTIPKGSGKYVKVIGNVPDYADDAAAAAGGVPVGGHYRTGSIMKIRVS